MYEIYIFVVIQTVITCTPLTKAHRRNFTTCAIVYGMIFRK